MSGLPSAMDEELCQHCSNPSASRCWYNSEFPLATKQYARAPIFLSIFATYPALLYTKTSAYVLPPLPTHWLPVYLRLCHFPLQSCLKPSLQDLLRNLLQWKQLLFYLFCCYRSHPPRLRQKPGQTLENMVRWRFERIITGRKNNAAVHPEI